MSARREKKENVWHELEKLTENAIGRRERWQEHASCRHMHEELANEMFFTTDIHDPLKNKRRALCNRCPVQKQCFDYGNRTSPQYGAWGGYSAGERRAMIKYKGQTPPDGAVELEMRLAQL